MKEIEVKFKLNVKQKISLNEIVELKNILERHIGNVGAYYDFIDSVSDIEYEGVKDAI